MLVVIDYDAGNLYNVGQALKYLDVEYEMSGDPEVVSRADRVILPGVGSANAAMRSLREQELEEAIRSLEVPFLGICLGLQLLFDSSAEEETECLGVVEGRISLLDREAVKVPHIGWNEVDWRPGLDSGDPRVRGLLEGLPEKGYFYFVHSYSAPLANGVTLASTEYGETFSSAVARDNFIGVQFHAERSGELGLRLIRNFLNLS